MRFGRLIKKLSSLSLAPIHRSFSNSFRETTGQSVCLLEKIPFNELKGKVFYYKMVPVADRDEAQRFAAIGAPLVVRSLHSEDGVYGYYDNDQFQIAIIGLMIMKQKEEKCWRLWWCSLYFSITSESKETQSPKEDDESSSDEFDFEKSRSIKNWTRTKFSVQPSHNFLWFKREPHPVWKKM